MPTKKRRYVPKVKGCYPCARRRIHCDRTGPHCRKCTSRGLRCFGLGLEVQLIDGNAASVDSFSEQSETAGNPATTSVVCNNYDQLTAAQPQCAHEQTELHFLEDDIVVSHSLHTSETLPCSLSHAPLGSNEDHASSFIPFTGEDNRLLQPVSDHILPWKRQLCSHFSKHIAFEMVAIDDQHNSWRHLVLPFAYSNDLVMSAVLAVSSYHTHLIASSTLSHDGRVTGIMESLPINLYQLENSVISGLKERWDLSTCDLETRQSVLMTILVLQVGAMVTGRSDFPSLYKMLQSSFQASGCEKGIGNGEAAEFILSQVYKFRFYGATLLDEQAGLQAISSPSHAGRLLNSLSSRWTDNPKHSQTIHFVNDLVKQAIDLYIEQACLSSEEDDDEVSYNPQIGFLESNSIVRVQHFIETLDALLKSPVGASCEQVLIWATFVVASGCLIQDHINFFEDVFLRHYARCRFLNVLVGLETLRKIWSRRDTSKRWTSLIAQTKKLVM